MFPVSQYILGIQSDFDGLHIEPCIPAEIESFKIKRHYRRADIYINIQNPEHIKKGVKSIEVDGKILKGNYICPDGSKKEYYVTVLMG